jgi:hypothetical protein
VSSMRFSRFARTSTTPSSTTTALEEPYGDVPNPDVPNPPAIPQDYAMETRVSIATLLLVVGVRIARRYTTTAEAEFSI